MTKTTNKSSNNRVRYTEEQKAAAVATVRELASFDAASDKLNIPVYNLRTWAKAAAQAAMQTKGTNGNVATSRKALSSTTSLSPYEVEILRRENYRLKAANVALTQTITVLSGAYSFYESDEQTSIT